MALTAIQERICRLLADRRISQDVDVFHDTEQAVDESSTADRALLLERGFVVTPVRELRGFVEVLVQDGRGATAGAAALVQWARDSAFRFFPLVSHPVFGLTLHPFDLATNKVAALVGRVEVRDWIDILTCHERLTPLGCLAWAAAGKDPGLGPGFILEEAARTARYTNAEVSALAFDGQPPALASLSSTWRVALAEARRIVERLPAEHLGCAVLASAAPGESDVFRGRLEQLERALEAGQVRFHRGSIGGAFPKVGG